VRTDVETYGVGIIALGSTGDVLPFAGLGQALAEAGHVVTIAAPGCASPTHHGPALLSVPGSSAGGGVRPDPRSAADREPARGGSDRGDLCTELPGHESGVG